MLTPFEVSSLLGIPDSSLRRLARQFAEFLSPQPHTRKRRYTQRDVDILGTARELLGGGATVEQVKAKLAQTVDLQPQDESPQDSTALVPIIRQLSQLNEQYNAIAAQLEQLHQDRAADRGRIADLEKQLSELSRPWWKRILRG